MCLARYFYYDFPTFNPQVHHYPQNTGGATPRFWTPTTPPTSCWSEAPFGGGGGIAGGVHSGRMGGGSSRGWGGGGLREGRLGGGVQVGQFGVVGGGQVGQFGVLGGRGFTGSPYLLLPSL